VKKYDKITSVIEGEGDEPPRSSNIPILKKSGAGGKFSSRELNEYLDNYEEVGLLRNDGLIDEDVAYDEFYYDIEKIWCNKDIHNDVLPFFESLLGRAFGLI